MLLTGGSSVFGTRSSVDWAEAAKLPLCLLTPDMQNRRILDLHFQQAGAKVHAVVEANSMITLWSEIRLGGLSTVVPESFLLLLGGLGDLTAIPLTRPDAVHSIGLVASRYAAGTREILECWFERRPIRDEYLIVDGGKLAGAGAHAYSIGQPAVK